MSIYLYDWHFAPRLKLSKREMSSYSLYCQDCGESDKFLGKAENAEEILEVIKDRIKLINCAHCNNCGQFNHCLNNCEETRRNGKYDYSETLNTIYSTFEKELKEKPHFVYLICKPEANENLILLDEINALPAFICLNKEQVNVIGLDLLTMVHNLEKNNLHSFSKILEKEYEDKIVHVFSCLDSLAKERTIYGKTGTLVQEIYRYKEIDKIANKNQDIINILKNN